MKLLSIFFGFLMLVISPLKDLSQLINYKSEGVGLNTTKLEHLSSNCKVESVKSINSVNDGKIYIITLFRGKMDFSVTNKSYSNNHFYINSNFFGHKGEPLGEVKINGKTFRNRLKGGGFFHTNGQNGSVSVYSRPNSKFISQTGYVSIRNGSVNNSYNKTRWGKLTTDRILIGENKSGDIIVIHTGYFGSTTIKNMNLIAKKFGIINGIHLDGGSSVQVKLKDGFYKHEYKALSDFSRSFTNIPEPPIHIVGNFIK